MSFQIEIDFKNVSLNEYHAFRATHEQWSNLSHIRASSISTSKREINLNKKILAYFRIFNFEDQSYACVEIHRGTATHLTRRATFLDPVVIAEGRPTGNQNFKQNLRQSIQIPESRM